MKGGKHYIFCDHTYGFQKRELKRLELCGLGCNTWTHVAGSSKWMLRWSSSMMPLVWPKKVGGLGLVWGRKR